MSARSTSKPKKPSAGMRTFDQLSRQQLEIYARELREHFSDKRRLHHELADREHRLEQRLREVAAIGRINETISRQNQRLSLAHAPHAGHDLSGPHGEVDGATMTTAELSVQAVLQMVVDLSREVGQARCSGLMVLEDTLPRAFITSGLDAKERKAMEAYLRDRGIQGILNQEAWPVLVKHTAPSQRGARFSQSDIPITSLLGVPIVHKGRHVGNLYLINKQDAPEFSQEDSSLMVTFATLAAVAIENTQSYRQVQAQAVQGERDRIGKDLHDNTIQSLYALGLNLEDCAGTVMEAPGEVKERLHSAVEKLNEVIRNTRDYIMDLKPEAQAGDTLRERLEGLLEELGNTMQVKVTLQWELQEALDLAPNRVAHLMSIAREALTNVAKHANAHTVTLGLARRDGDVRMWVQDDGAGFVAQLAKGSRPQGLRNMKERARALGGHLLIESGPGRGTRLEVVFPADVAAPSPAGRTG